MPDPQPNLEQLVRHWSESGSDTAVKFVVKDGKALLIFQRADSGPKVFSVVGNTVKRE